MARQARFEVVGSPHLVIQRGATDRSAFADDAAYEAYEAALAQVATDRTAFVVDAYAFTRTEASFLVTPLECGALARFVQRLHRRGRSTTPATGPSERWEGRYRSVALEAEHYLLDAVRFVEQSPVRTGLTAAAWDWRWSSAGARCGLRPFPTWLATHPLLFGLSNTPFGREGSHRRLLADQLAESAVRTLVQASSLGRPVGPPEYLATIAGDYGRPVIAARRGRPGG